MEVLGAQGCNFSLGPDDFDIFSRTRSFDATPCTRSSRCLDTQSVAVSVPPPAPSSSSAPLFPPLDLPFGTFLSGPTLSPASTAVVEVGSVGMATIAVGENL